MISCDFPTPAVNIKSAVYRSMLGQKFGSILTVILRYSPTSNVPGFSSWPGRGWSCGRTGARAVRSLPPSHRSVHRGSAGLGTAYRPGRHPASPVKQTQGVLH